MRNHTLLIHSGSAGGSTSDLSSSSLSSLNSTQQLSDSASSPPLGITLKNSINLVAIKSSKSGNGLSNGASTSKGNKESGKDGNGNKIPKLTPMKGYDGLGILTPATSPKNQQQQQQQQLISDSHGNVLNGSVDNIPLTPVSPAASPSSSTTSNTSYQQLKKPDS